MKLEKTPKKFADDKVSHLKIDEIPIWKQDLSMMKNPGKWRQYPILPIKRMDKSGGMPEFGLLLPIKNPVVYLANMWDLEDLGIKTAGDITSKIKSISYASFEAILDDGWIVD